MNFFVQRSGLCDLHEKVAAGERISEANALRLFESKDLNAVGAIADLARQKKTGNNRASYILNRYVNYSNYCILSCQFCSFARKKRDADGFELTTEQIVEKAREALKLGITELHIVGGLHPSLPFSYYTDMLKALKALNVDSGTGVSPVRSKHELTGETPVPLPKLHLKCFTAIEILHLAWLAKKSVEETLRELKAAGLDSLSTCTMLYGHVESLADRVDHLRQLRALQDETHGFVGFVPLPYQPEDNDIPVEKPPTGFDSLRTIAVSRAYLDNFDHITAYWVGLGLKLAQVALSYGADDLHGTIIEEHIFHMAGAVADRGGNDKSHSRSRPHAGPAQHVLRADKNSGNPAGARGFGKLSAFQGAGG